MKSTPTAAVSGLRATGDSESRLSFRDEAVKVANVTRLGEGRRRVNSSRASVGIPDSLSSLSIPFTVNVVKWYFNSKNLKVLGAQLETYVRF
jgi:metal-dependent HD superfamily phosphatase/phosphodiesterase